MIATDFEFPHSYEVEEAPELPGSGKSAIPWHYIPRPTTRPEHDGHFVKIVPKDAKPWVGIFAFGYDEPPAISKLISLPILTRLCVISSGVAYIGEADNPSSFERLEFFPVTAAASVPQHNLIVLGGFDRLVAYSGESLLWESPRLCWDDLRITSIRDNTIEGVGYDPTIEGESRFWADVRTGESLIPPPMSIDGQPVW